MAMVDALFPDRRNFAVDTTLLVHHRPGLCRRRWWLRDSERSRLHGQGVRVMKNPFRILRLSNVLKEQDAAHLKAVRDTVAKSRELLNDDRPVDTFAGRKTQEPFPDEDDRDTRTVKWIGSNELKPPA